MKMFVPQNYKKIDFLSAGMFLYCSVGLILLLATAFIIREYILIRALVAVLCPLVCLRPRAIRKTSNMLSRLYSRIKLFN